MTDKSKKPKFDTQFDRLPNLEAIASFNGKALLTSQDYAHFKAYEHALAFTVAKIADQDMLTEVHKAVKSAIDNGTSFHDFKKRLKPYLMARGWLAPAFKNDNVDDDKETFKDYQKHLGHRLRTIYHTNKHTAYASGQWERIQRTKAFLPFLQYMPSTSVNKRDEHKQFYGIIRPVDDEIWTKIFAPNGFGCKCWIKQLTKSKAEKLGITSDDDIAKLDYDSHTNPKTGEQEMILKGVHPSFNHNHDRLTAMLKLAEDKHGSEWARQLQKEVDKLLPSRADVVLTGVGSATPVALMDEVQALEGWLDDEYRLSVYKQEYQSLNKKKYPFSETEYMAIRYYTTSGYEKLNAYLNGFVELDKNEQMMFNSVQVLLNRALEQLPIHKNQTLVRTLDLTDEQLAKYQVGGLIEFPAFTSTTYGKKAVEIGGGKNTKLIITHKTGRKIDELSHFKSEKEVLLGSPTKYKVENIKYNNKTSQVEIYLEQITEWMP